MVQVRDLNDNLPSAITKINSIADSGFTKFNGISYDGSYDGSVYNGVTTYSCLFAAPASTVTSYNPVAAPDDSNLITVSFWVKRAKLGTTQTILSGYTNDNNRANLTFGSGDQLSMVNRITGAIDSQYVTTQVFRDCSAWYHICFCYDSDQAAAADRFTLWVNGSEITAYDTEDTVTSGAAQRFFISGNVANIGRKRFGTQDYLDGYLAEFHYVDGLAKTASDFGEFQGNIWVPKAYTGGWGTAGFYLDFSNGSDFGEDQSGNGNDLTDSSLGTDHQMGDNPEDNYCSPEYSTLGTVSYWYDGGLFIGKTTAAWAGVLGTFLLKSGKWYFEVTHGSDPYYVNWGICDGGLHSADMTTDAFSPSATGVCHMGQTFGTSSYYVENDGGGTTDDTNLAAPANSDTMMMAIDCDSGKVWFGSNGTWGNWGGAGVGDPANGNNPAFTLDFDLYDYVPFIAPYDNDGGAVDYCRINFGALQTLANGGFVYAPPTGFNTMKTSNLSDPVLDDCGDAVDVITYTGTGAELAISDFAFQPDFVWIKNRDAADPHHIFDSEQTATYWLESDSGAVQQSGAQTLKSFDTNGFTLGTDGEVNTNTEDYMALGLLKASDYGFDIVTYTGTGVAHAESHSLSAVPKLIIVKNLDDTDSWVVYHYALSSRTDPETDYGILDLASAWADNATLWNDTAPTSTQFTVGTAAACNTSGENYIAYLFNDIEGFSKVFAVTANNSADGAYIYCGFRPKWIVQKGNAAANDWIIVDAARDTYNPVDYYLQADVPDAETASTLFDINSNGFKHKAAFTNNQVYAGIAFADQPFKYANAR